MSSADWKPNPALEARIREATRAASEAAAKVVLEQSKRNTPVDTGRLVGSAHVVVDGDDAAVVYDSTIAAAVHEDMTEHHEHGGAKYLERAMNSTQRGALEASAKAYRERIGD